jgi:hypothetical protein
MADDQSSPANAPRKPDAARPDPTGQHPKPKQTEPLSGGDLPGPDLGEGIDTGAIQPGKTGGATAQ